MFSSDWVLLKLIVKLFAETKLRKLRRDRTQLNSKDILNDLKSYRKDKVGILWLHNILFFKASFTVKNSF